MNSHLSFAFERHCCLHVYSLQDHLSRAFGNLEYRLLNEINHLKAMLNLILPPPYQQHYFAQPQPQLYESPPTPTTEIPITPEPSTTKAWNSIDASVIDSTDSIQNESPLVYQNVTLSTQDSSNKTQPNDDLVVASTMASATEKMLHFRPVQKKTDKEINKASSKQKKYALNQILRYFLCILTGSCQIYIILPE